MSVFEEQTMLVELTTEDFGLVGRLKVPGTNADSEFSLHSPHVVIDSRSAETGSVFVALKGSQTDGHEFVWKAFEKGAALCIVAAEWWDVHAKDSEAETFTDRCVLVTTDPLIALQRLANGYRRKFNIPLVAIGGSNGKTTTKEMVARVLGMSFEVMATKGNLNNHIGVPLTLFNLRPTTEIAVLELGINHPGEMMQLCRIAEPTHGLLTNIGLEHTEFFKTKDMVARAEGELFNFLNTNDGECFVNLDDEFIVSRLEDMQKATCYGIYNSKYKCGVWMEEFSLDEKGFGTFAFRSATETAMVKLSISGRHNISNALAAACVGQNFGLPLNIIADALGSFEPISGSMRMERETIGGIEVINDAYNANPESMAAAIEVLSNIKIPGKRIAVLGDMLELGEISREAHVDVGEKITKSNIDMLFAFGPEMKGACQGATEKCKGHFEDKAALTGRLLECIKPGDAMLIKGSRGMKMEEILIELKKVINN
jgi:UDP-N-acetylmuramoyl-tripeptide--D-alanyl-D-alanine ligase